MSTLHEFALYVLMNLVDFLMFLSFYSILKSQLLPVKINYWKNLHVGEIIYICKVVIKHMKYVEIIECNV